jgi:hypothetical protein
MGGDATQSFGVVFSNPGIQCLCRAAGDDRIPVAIPVQMPNGHIHD